MTKKGAELLTLSKKEFIKLVWVDYREIGKQVMIQAAEKMKMLKSEYRKGLNHIKKNKDKMALLMEDENDHEKRKSVNFFKFFSLFISSIYNFYKVWRGEEICSKKQKHLAI